VVGEPLVRRLAGADQAVEHRPDQNRRDDLGIDVGAHPEGLGSLGVLGRKIPVVRRKPTNDRPRQGRVAHRLGDEGREELPEPRLGEDRHRAPPTAREIGGDVPGQCVRRPALDRGGGGHEQAVARGVAAIDRRPGDAGALDDRARRQPGEAAFAEDRDRGVEDPAIGAGAPRPAAAVVRALDRCRRHDTTLAGFDTRQPVS